MQWRKVDFQKIFDFASSYTPFVDRYTIFFMLRLMWKLFFSFFFFLFSFFFLLFFFVFNTIGLIEPSKVVQIGIRGTLNEADQWGFSYDHGMRVVQIEEVQELGMAGVIELTRDLIGDAPTYFTFDIDALDPVSRHRS